MKSKGQIVSQFLDKTSSEVVWDLGANTGQFSQICNKKCLLVISIDNDPLTIEKNYLRCLKKNETNILPLTIDLTRLHAILCDGRNHLASSNLIIS